MTLQFFDRLDKIDEIINGGPEKCNFKIDLAPLLQEPSSIKHFYEKIKEPAWMEILKAAGEFKNPSKPIVDNRGGRYSLYGPNHNI